MDDPDTILLSCAEAPAAVPVMPGSPCLDVLSKPLPLYGGLQLSAENGGADKIKSI